MYADLVHQFRYEHDYGLWNVEGVGSAYDPRDDHTTRNHLSDPGPPAATPPASRRPTGVEMADKDCWMRQKTVGSVLMSYLEVLTSIPMIYTTDLTLQP